MTLLLNVSFSLHNNGTSIDQMSESMVTPCGGITKVNAG